MELVTSSNQFSLPPKLPYMNMPGHYFIRLYGDIPNELMHESIQPDFYIRRCKNFQFSLLSMAIS